MGTFIFIIFIVVIIYFIFKSNAKRVDKIKNENREAYFNHVKKQKQKLDEMKSQAHSFSQFRQDFSNRDLNLQHLISTQADEFLDQNKNHPAVLPKENFQSIEKSFNGRHNVKSYHVCDYENEKIIKYSKLILKDGISFQFDEFNYFFPGDELSKTFRYTGSEFWQQHQDYAIVYPSQFSAQTLDFMSKFISALHDVEKTYNLEFENQQNNYQMQLNAFKESFKNDVSSNGKLILSPNDFAVLIDHNQEEIANIDSKYLHQFVKVSNFINKKKENLQIIFENSFNSNNIDEMKFFEQSIKDQLNSYNLILFHSLNMVSALLSNKMIAFYEIYEEFDKLNIFNSNWENEVNANLNQMNYQLGNIADSLKSMLYKMERMEKSIVNSIENLTYVTQSSYDSLNENVNSNLKAIESSINTNTLLSAINSYQIYKLRKQQS